MSSYAEKLLTGWEDVHKKSQLTLWILLALKSTPRQMADIKEAISEITNNTISADDKSMYRALRRFKDAELVDYTVQPNAKGPDYKLYKLTPVGQEVLSQFIDRNITSIFLNPAIVSLLRD